MNPTDRDKDVDTLQNLEINPGEKISIGLSKEDRGKHHRLDQLLVEKLPHLSRARIKDLFLKNCIQPRNRLKLNKMPPEDLPEIEVSIPKPVEPNLTPWEFPLKVLFEDEFLLVIEKPAGIVTHPAPGHWEKTLVHALLHHCKELSNFPLSGVGDELRPGIVHRLDQGTSGVMIVAKGQKTHEKLVKIFQAHDIIREYIALCFRVPQVQKGYLKSQIARDPKHRQRMTSKVKSDQGKQAITHYEVLESYSELAAQVLFTLETGRTHQIRVHASEILQCPLLGDPVYANLARQKKALPPELYALISDHGFPFLHARRLKLTHPETGQVLDFQTPLPLIFQRALSILK